MLRTQTIGLALALTGAMALCCAGAEIRSQAAALAGHAEQAYREGDFVRARQLFAAALTHDRGFVAAELGLVRLDLMESYRMRAAERMSRLAENAGGDPAVRDAMRMMEEFRASTEVVRTNAAEYTVPLRMDQRGAEPEGVTITVSLNGGRPLRLLVDTGASHILLHEQAAAGLALRDLRTGSISGYGDGAQAARVGLATLRCGELELDGARVYVANREFANGIDGLIGTRVFRQFLIRLDVRAKRMTLSPFASGGTWTDWDRESGWEERGFAPFYQLGHYLLVRGESGLLLLDTGASFSALDRQMTMRSGRAMVKPVRNGADPLADSAVQEMDLLPWSLRNGVRLRGVIGFPAIRHGVLTLNYRDGYWKLSR